MARAGAFKEYYLLREGSDDMPRRRKEAIAVKDMARHGRQHFALDRTRKYGMDISPQYRSKTQIRDPRFYPAYEIKPFAIGSFRRSAVGKDVLFSHSLARASRTNRRRFVGLGSTYSVAGLSAKSSASRIKPGQFAPAQYQQVQRQAAMPIDPIANRDRIKLKHAFGRLRLGMQVIMSVLSNARRETPVLPGEHANPIVRHHA